MKTSYIVRDVRDVNHGWRTWSVAIWRSHSLASMIIELTTTGTIWLKSSLSFWFVKSLPPEFVSNSTIKYSRGVTLVLPHQLRVRIWAPRWGLWDNLPCSSESLFWGIKPNKKPMFSSYTSFLLSIVSTTIKRDSHATHVGEQVFAVSWW